MVRRFFINPYGVLFHPELDQKNNYTTIVCNWRTGKVLKINRFGYEILRTVSNNPGLLGQDIHRLVSRKQSVTEEKINRFLGRMAQENIIFEK